MAHSGVIVVKDKDQIVPKPYIEKVLEHNPTAYGMALVEKGAILDDIVSKDVSADVIMQLQEGFKKEVAVFHFGNYPAGYMVGDLQPFEVLKDDNKQPALVAFVEGNFSSQGKEKSSHTNEFFAVYDGLTPKLQMLYNLADHNIGKLMGVLATTPTFKKDLSSLWVDRGTILLLACTGQIYSYSINPLEKKFDWGWTSNHYDFGVEKEMSPADLIRAKQAAKIAGVITETKPTVGPIAGIAPTPPKTETSVPAITQPKMVQCPVTVRGKKNIAEWYRANAGYNPLNYKQRPVVEVKSDLVTGEKKGEIIKTFQDLPKDLPVIPGVKPAEPPAEPVSEPAGPSTPIPVIPKKEQDAVIGFIKTIGADSREILSPKSIQDLEQKYPTFAQYCGMEDLGFIRSWPYSAFVELVENPSYRATSHVLLFNLRNALITQNPAWGLTKEKKEEPAVKIAGIKA
jgi:hypothetical protein